MMKSVRELQAASTSPTAYSLSKSRCDADTGRIAIDGDATARLCLGEGAVTKVEKDDAAEADKRCGAGRPTNIIRSVVE
jgi:hypothetical protein